MGTNVEKCIKMLVLPAEPEETSFWLCWTSMLGQKTFSNHLPTWQALIHLMK